MKILIFLLIKSFLISPFFALAMDRFGDGEIYVILNSTQYRSNIRTLWLKNNYSVLLQENLDSSECIYINSRYCNDQEYNPSYPGNNCSNWIFRSISITIDDDRYNVYKRFKYFHANHFEVVGDSGSFFGLINGFRLPKIPKHRRYQLIKDSSCKVFIPELAYFIGGDGNTALHDAVRENDLDTTIRLMGEGASVNLRNRGGFNAWDFANRNGNRSIMKVLEDNGAKSGRDLETLRPQRNFRTPYEFKE